MDSTRNPQHALTFRKEDVSYIMNRWKVGESCSVIGVGSVGKSNLLHHLANTNVQQHYLDLEQPESFKAIIIDPNMLGALPAPDKNSDAVRCWAGYELMMHRLFMAFYPFDVLGNEEAQEFYDTYQALQDGMNPLYAYMGVRYFELGLDFFLRRGIRIVFMFDEFEKMLEGLPIQFFLNLRGLRDANKRQLSYLTFTRTPLSAIVDKLGFPTQTIEPFIELFTDNTYYIGPYNDADAAEMIEVLLHRHQKRYDEAAIRFLKWATGCNAGLLRATFRLLDSVGRLDVPVTQDDEFIRPLVIRRPIRLECQTMWQSLTDVEMTVLKAVSGHITYDIDSKTEQGVAMLVQKQLLRVDKAHNTLHIQPPLFRLYVNQQLFDED